jgi:hypothetical protein
MNNDSTPTDLPTSENPTSTSAAEPAANSVESTQRRQDEGSPAQKRAQAQMKKKFEFITSLINNLDILIYAELSIIYYMEYGQLYLYLFFTNMRPAAPSSVFSSVFSIR